MRKPEEGPPRGRPTGPGVSEHLGYGLTWAASTIVFLLLGREADGWLATEPVLTLLGALVGASAGFYYMYHHLVVEPRERERERREEEE